MFDKQLLKRLDNGTFGHEYVSIDNEKLHQFLSSLNDFNDFVSELKQELK